MHRRVQGAAARTTALNERFLRRFAAELHDGPAQDISLALLRLDNVAARDSATEGEESAQNEQDLEIIQSSLQHALQEVRSSSAGLMLPQIGELSVDEVIEHAAQSHRRRTRSAVEVSTSGLPMDVSLPTKIAIYRIIQEALQNAWRHAYGKEQRVSAAVRTGAVVIEVSDGGPGFDVGTIGDSEHHLGLVGMRERVESLGGEFRIESEPARGTRVIASLPLRPTEENHG